MADGRRDIENTEEAHRRKSIEPALPNACAVCPWRISNQGQPHPHGFYDRANIKRLWDGIRKGDAPGMTCHPTDPHMAEYEGYEDTADREATHECMGSWVMRSPARWPASMPCVATSIARRPKGPSCAATRLSAATAPRHAAKE